MPRLRCCPVLLLVLGAACGSSGSGSKGPEFDGPAQFACQAPEDTGPIFHVLVDGSDDSGDGSEAAPWATIGHGITQVPDGATLLVGPGTYDGRVRLDSQFAEGVTVRAEPSYEARLRSDGLVVSVYEGQGITLSGFDIAHSGPGAEPLVVQIQDLLGDGGGPNGVSRITLRNNIIHDSYNNDILKVNNGAREIVIERNVFYNQQGSDEHIDINSVSDVVVQDNIFFNDFAASGRSDGGQTSSYIVIKDSNGSDDALEGSSNITLRRNVFLNWEGDSATGFLLIGEDGNPYHEAFDVQIENNLIVGNSSSPLRSPFGIKGGKDITFRNNTVVGDMPGGAFAFRFNVEGDNPANQNIALYNNIWSDPTGTMDDFSDTPQGETSSFVIDNNLYWNGGAALPSDGEDLVNPGDDASRVEGDPLLPFVPGALPTWSESAGRFADGSGDICLAFERLVMSYGAVQSGSAAIGAARADESPATDILGKLRGDSLAIGAYQP